jgi:hypothetical protein
MAKEIIKVEHIDHMYGDSELDKEARLHELRFVIKDNKKIKNDN